MKTTEEKEREFVARWVCDIAGTSSRLRLPLSHEPIPLRDLLMATR